MAVDRPRDLKDFIGQSHLKSLIKTAIDSAKKRNAPFPHSLVTGPAGMGKTSLSAVIASEMNVRFLPVTAESLSDSYAVKGLISQIDDSGYDREGKPSGQIYPTILLLDEAHRLPRQSQELLYACIEDRVLDTRVKDPLTGLLKPVREWVPFFTLIAASNRPGDLTSAFRDRLRLHLRLDPYSVVEASRIAKQTLTRLGIRCSPQQATAIAHRGRGTPRRIITVCEHLRDLAVCKGKVSVNAAICQQAFKSIGLDALGLEKADLELLRLLAQSAGTPLGLKTIAAVLNADERTLEETVEPFLLAKNLIVKTVKGRAVTEHGLSHLQKHHGWKPTEGNRRALP
jgi:Holliday junction DNA helicase RuvB